MDKVYYGMATYPPRKKCLKEVIDTILPQCTKLYIFLNQYKEIPTFLNRKKVRPILGNKEGNCGDIGKFWFVDQLNGYYFTVDDDILYPYNYSQKMIAALEYHKRNAVIGVHGCVLNMRHMWNYYRARNLTNYRNGLQKERRVHVIGTGTAAFHTDTFKLSKDCFRVKNMADIWFAVEGQKQKIPFILIQRPSYWLRDAPSARQTTSIYSRSKNKKHGEYQTKVIKEYGNWKIYS